MSNQTSREWHLDKTVSVTHLISTIAAVVTVSAFLMKQDTRISLLEQNAVAQQRDVADFKTVVRGDLQSINAKLDRLIERK